MSVDDGLEHSHPGCDHGEGKVIRLDTIVPEAHERCPVCEDEELGGHLELSTGDFGEADGLAVKLTAQWYRGTVVDVGSGFVECEAAAGYRFTVSEDESGRVRAANPSNGVSGFAHELRRID